MLTLERSKAMKYVKRLLDDDDTKNLRLSLSMQRRKLSPDPVCDFCGNELPVVVYGAKRMTVGAEIRCWRWCACTPCMLLIDSQTWNLLSNRIIAALTQLMPIELERQVLSDSVALCLETFKKDVLLDDDIGRAGSM
jgi:hypothetical protein